MTTILGLGLADDDEVQEYIQNCRDKKEKIDLLVWAKHFLAKPEDRIPLLTQIYEEKYREKARLYQGLCLEQSQINGMTLKHFGIPNVFGEVSRHFLSSHSDLKKILKKGAKGKKKNPAEKDKSMFYEEDFNGIVMEGRSDAGAFKDCRDDCLIFQNHSDSSDEWMSSSVSTTLADSQRDKHRSSPPTRTVSQQPKSLPLKVNTNYLQTYKIRTGKNLQSSKRNTQEESKTQPLEDIFKKPSTEQLATGTFSKRLYNSPGDAGSFTAASETKSTTSDQNGYSPEGERSLINTQKSLMQYKKKLETIGIKANTFEKFQIPTSPAPKKRRYTKKPHDDKDSRMRQLCKTTQDLSKLKIQGIFNKSTKKQASKTEQSSFSENTDFSVSKLRSNTKENNPPAVRTLSSTQVASSLVFNGRTADEKTVQQNESTVLNDVFEENEQDLRPGNASCSRKTSCKSDSNLSSGSVCTLAISQGNNTAKEQTFSHSPARGVLSDLSNDATQKVKTSRSPTSNYDQNMIANGQENVLSQVSDMVLSPDVDMTEFSSGRKTNLFETELSQTSSTSNDSSTQSKKTASSILSRKTDCYDLSPEAVGQRSRTTHKSDDELSPNSDTNLIASSRGNPTTEQQAECSSSTSRNLQDQVVQVTFRIGTGQPCGSDFNQTIIANGHEDELSQVSNMALSPDVDMTEVDFSRSTNLSRTELSPASSTSNSSCSQPTKTAPNASNSTFAKIITDKANETVSSTASGIIDDHSSPRPASQRSGAAHVSETDQSFDSNATLIASSQVSRTVNKKAASHSPASSNSSDEPVQATNQIPTAPSSDSGSDWSIISSSQVNGTCQVADMAPSPDVDLSNVGSIKRNQSSNDLSPTSSTSNISCSQPSKTAPNASNSTFAKIIMDKANETVSSTASGIMDDQLTPRLVSQRSGATHVSETDQSFGSNGTLIASSQVSRTAKTPVASRSPASSDSSDQSVQAIHQFATARSSDSDSDQSVIPSCQANEKSQIDTSISTGSERSQKSSSLSFAHQLRKKNVEPMNIHQKLGNWSVLGAQQQDTSVESMEVDGASEESDPDTHYQDLFQDAQFDKFSTTQASVAQSVRSLTSISSQSQILSHCSVFEGTATSPLKNTNNQLRVCERKVSSGFGSSSDVLGSEISGLASSSPTHKNDETFADRSESKFDDSLSPILSRRNFFKSLGAEADFDDFDALSGTQLVTDFVTKASGTDGCGKMSVTKLSNINSNSKRSVEKEPTEFDTEKSDTSSQTSTLSGLTWPVGVSFSAKDTIVADVSVVNIQSENTGYEESIFDKFCEENYNYNPEEQADRLAELYQSVQNTFSSGFTNSSKTDRLQEERNSADLTTAGNERRRKRNPLRDRSYDIEINATPKPISGQISMQLRERRPASCSRDKLPVAEYRSTKKESRKNKKSMMKRSTEESHNTPPEKPRQKRTPKQGAKEFGCDEDVFSKMKVPLDTSISMSSGSSAGLEALLPDSFVSELRGRRAQEDEVTKLWRDKRGNSSDSLMSSRNFSQSSSSHYFSEMDD